MTTYANSIHGVLSGLHPFNRAIWCMCTTQQCCTCPWRASAVISAVRVAKPSLCFVPKSSARYFIVSRICCTSGPTNRYSRPPRPCIHPQWRECVYYWYSRSLRLSLGWDCLAWWQVHNHNLAFHCLYSPAPSIIHSKYQRIAQGGREDFAVGRRCISKCTSSSSWNNNPL